MYIKLNNGVIEKFPYSIGDIRKENSNVSFPRILGNDLLATFNVFPVTEQDKPDTDRFSYAVKRDLPELVDGAWVVFWDVVQKTVEELVEDDEQQAESVRDSRNRMLAETDWTQIADAPVDKAAWATYRQALRDITDHANFPYLEEADWPTQPE